jgi:hypothetical protein
MYQRKSGLTEKGDRALVPLQDFHAILKALGLGVSSKVSNGSHFTFQTLNKFTKKIPNCDETTSMIDDLKENNLRASRKTRNLSS